MKQEDLSLNSPKARHWYVTNRMRLIKETTQSEGQLAQKMAELVVYMARRRNIERLRTFFYCGRGKKNQVDTVKIPSFVMKKYKRAKI